MSLVRSAALAITAVVWIGACAAFEEDASPSADAGALDASAGDGAAHPSVCGDGYAFCEDFDGASNLTLVPVTTIGTPAAITDADGKTGRGKRFYLPAGSAFATVGMTFDLSSLDDVEVSADIRIANPGATFSANALGMLAAGLGHPPELRVEAKFAPNAGEIQNFVRGITREDGTKEGGTVTTGKGDLHLPYDTWVRVTLECRMSSASKTGMASQVVSTSLGALLTQSVTRGAVSAPAGTMTVLIGWGRSQATEADLSMTVDNIGVRKLN